MRADEVVQIIMNETPFTTDHGSDIKVPNISHSLVHPSPAL